MGPSHSVGGTFPLRRWVVDALQRDPSVALEDVVVDPHRMRSFLVGLGTHPRREPWESLVLVVGGHREVHVLGVEFGVDLFVQRLLDRVFEHDPEVYFPTWHHY